MRTSLAAGPAIDPEEIKAIADVDTVAEYLGLEMQRHGRRMSILCPSHLDRHHGSCFLTKNGYKCYSCGASGDVIALVQAVNNCSFPDACEYIADIYGIKPSASVDGKTKRKKLLDSKYLSLIGLGAEQERLYIDRAIIPAPINPDFPLEPGQRLKWFPADSEDQEDYYVLQELVSSNPLRDLLETDEAEYHALICRKATEAADMYRNLLKYAQNPSKAFEECRDSVQNLAMMYGAEIVCREVGILPWIREMETRIRQCENLRIEHSSIHEPKRRESEIPLRSVFGKLKRGGISF